MSVVRGKPAPVCIGASENLAPRTYDEKGKAPGLIYSGAMFMSGHSLARLRRKLDDAKSDRSSIMSSGDASTFKDLPG